VKLDIGCGPNPKEGFEGVDQYAFDGKVKHVLDVRKTPWPWPDGSVDEIHSSHFIEHLTGEERVGFINECHRVLKVGGTINLIAPHWASNRAYGDPTHQWPPVAEMWFYYLSREWRRGNAPHTDKANWVSGFDCDFEATWGYSMRQDLLVRNQEYQQYAIANFKEAAQDLIATLKKR
jgi:hypothetical protein